MLKLKKKKRMKIYFWIFGQKKIAHETYGQK